jgi:hypothetical protein
LRPPSGPYAPGFSALHYDIALELPTTGMLIRGLTTIRVGISAPRASTLSLNLTGLAVDRVRVENAPAPSMGITLANSAGRSHGEGDRGFCRTDGRSTETKNARGRASCPRTRYGRQCTFC